jgi:hypothetical protein
MKRAGVNLADMIDPVNALTVNYSLRTVTHWIPPSVLTVGITCGWAGAAGRDPGSEAIGGLSAKQQ